MNWNLRTFGPVLLVFFFLMVSHLLPGCGKKASETQTISKTGAPAELPELPQNKIYLTNRTQPDPEPDYSFKPFPNDIKPASQEEIDQVPLED